MLTILSWCKGAPCDPCSQFVPVCKWGAIFSGGFASGNNIYPIQGDNSPSQDCPSPNIHLKPTGFIGGKGVITGIWTASGPSLFSIVTVAASIRLNGAQIWSSTVSTPFNGTGQGFAIEFDDQYLGVSLTPFPWTIEFQMSGPGSPEWFGSFNPVIEAYFK